MRQNSTRWLVTLGLAVASAAVFAATPADAADDTLKGLMKKMGAQTSAGDAKGLAPIFAQTKSMAKSDFPNWGSIAEKGQAAADKGDIAGAKATCKECHDAYRNTYKTKYGSKAP